MRRHLRGYVDYTICITCITYQQLWGYKVEEKLYLGVREQKRLNTTVLEKSKLAQHAYEEGHGVSWDEARILEIVSNSRHRKYKESAHTACSTNPIRQPSLEISPTWILLISKKVSKLKT
jgi:hypothetical protein